MYYDQNASEESNQGTKNLMVSLKDLFSYQSTPKFGFMLKDLIGKNGAADNWYQMLMGFDENTAQQAKQNMQNESDNINQFNIDRANHLSQNRDKREQQKFNDEYY